MKGKNILKKKDITEFMIVETGYGDEKLIVMKGCVVDDDLNGFKLEDFDEDLINIKDRPNSISKVYESVKLNVPFELNIAEIFKKQQPKLLWEESRLLSVKNI